MLRMKKTTSPPRAALEKHYDRLRQKLARTGYISRGSVLARSVATSGRSGYQWTRKVKGKEIVDGTECLRALVELLPKLAAVVMVGKAAARARHCLEAFRLELFASCHPSPINRAASRAKWDAIPSEWAKVRVWLRGI